MGNVFGGSDDGSDSGDEVKRPVKKLKINRDPSPKSLDDEVEEHEDYKTMPIATDGVVKSSSDTKPKNMASLDTSLFETSSIGLSMMQKMGFKVGDTLGLTKEAQREPLKVIPKLDKSGIKVRHKARPGVDVKRETIDEYHKRRLDRQLQRKVAYDVRKLQKFCFEASGDGATVHTLKQARLVNPLWRSLAIELNTHAREGRVLIDQETPEEVAVEDETPDSFSVNDPTDQLKALINHARAEYNYCLYCQIQFKDTQDLEANCSGPYEEDHAL